MVKFKLLSIPQFNTCEKRPKQNIAVNIIVKLLYLQNQHA